MSYDKNIKIVFFSKVLIVEDAKNKICEKVVGFANDFSFINERFDTIRDSIHKTKVSIVIPYYNRLEKVKRTLFGLSKQTIPLENIQILVCVDDVDRSIEGDISWLAKMFGSFDYLYNFKNGFGLSRVRNLGLIHSKHDYIILLDDDMIPTTKFVESHLRVLLTSKSILSIGFRHHTYIDETNSLFDQSLLDEDFSISELDWRVNQSKSWEELEDKVKFDTYFSWSFVSGGNVGFSRKVIDQSLFFDERFNTWGGEDNEWAYRLYKQGYYFYPNRNATAIHQDVMKIVSKINEPSRQYLKSKCPVVLDAYKDRNYKPSDIPLVSFWMCNNNRGKYIQKAIQSILDFPYRFEIVVVDDGSTDNSILKLTKMNLQNLTILKIPKNTLGYAYKMALDHCRGEYLIQLDSDDFIFDLEKLVDLTIYAMNHPFGLVYGHHFQVDEKGVFQSFGWKHQRCDREKLLFNGMHIHPPRIIKKRDYSRSRPIDITLETAVDFDLYSKILEVSYGSFVDLDIYAYRQHGKSVSSNLLESQKNNVAEIIKYRLIYYGQFGKCFFDDTIKRSCIVELEDKLTIDFHTK